MPATSIRGGTTISRLDERHRTDDRGFADDCVVVDDGVHADERVAFDDATVEHRAVTDVAVLADDGVGAGKAMRDAGILQVGARADLDPAEIAAQRRAGSDVAAGPD